MQVALLWRLKACAWWDDPTHCCWPELDRRTHRQLVCDVWRLDRSQAGSLHHAVRVRLAKGQLGGGVGLEAGTEKEAKVRGTVVARSDRAWS